VAESRSFLKKEPKNFSGSRLAPSGKAAAKTIKIVCRFFSKKQAFLP
jgi:hypothetical protein